MYISKLVVVQRRGTLSLLKLIKYAIHLHRREMKWTQMNSQATMRYLVCDFRYHPILFYRFILLDGQVSHPPGKRTRSSTRVRNDRVKEVTSNLREVIYCFLSFSWCYYAYIDYLLLLDFRRAKCSGPPMWKKILCKKRSMFQVKA